MRLGISGYNQLRTIHRDVCRNAVILVTKKRCPNRTGSFLGKWGVRLVNFYVSPTGKRCRTFRVGYLY